jgi:hypothetical protein
MKAYKVELLIIDHDKVGEEEMKYLIENVRYPNHCLHPHVMKITEKDIGPWTDDHPLNLLDKMEKEYQELFG